MKELTSRDFELAGCQAVAFTPEGELTSSTILRDLLPRWIEQFDAEPTILPSIPGAPRDVPRVLLQSKVGTLRCELAASRASFFWNRTAASPPPVAGAFALLVRFVLEYMETTARRVARLGAIVTRVAPHESPGMFLAQHFCKERWLAAPLNRPGDFELHAHKRFTMGPLVVNSWVRNKTGLFSASTGQPGQPIVVAEQDLNTLDEDTGTRTFTKAQAEEFFSLAVREFDTILRLYYPEEKKS